MFDLAQLDLVVEHDAPAVRSAGARSGADVYAELDPAVVEAGVRDLERMLTQAASHRRVSPDWPAPGSPWAGQVPGPELAALAAERLADPDLTQAQRLDCIDALDRSVNAIQGIKTAAIASFADRESRGYPGGVATGLKSAQAELEFLLKLSPTRSRNLVGRAMQLQSLPTTMAALKAGAVSLECAHAVADETALLEPEHKRAVEERIFPAATGHTEPRIKRAVRTAILEIDPELVRQRHEAEKRRRDVRLSTCPFGMSRLTAYLSAAEAQAIAGIVTAQAKTLKGDGRNWGERKADAFKEFFLGSKTGAKNGPRPRVSTQIRVVIPAGTALGLTDEPGFLAGYGPIPADLARDLAQDGTWRRLLTDPVSGEVLDYGTTRYRPGGALVERVRARDLECDAPECVIAAQDCDLDHETPYRADGTGGATSEHNLDLRCQHHHDVKHLPGWKARRNRDGTTLWTTPNGKTYLSRPPRFTPKRR
jgi:hypothetical protein